MSKSKNATKNKKSAPKKASKKGTSKKAPAKKAAAKEIKGKSGRDLVNAKSAKPSNKSSTQSSGGALMRDALSRLRQRVI